MDPLNELEQWAGGLLARLTPAARRRVTLAIARDLRRSQQARISKQRNPDGTAFAPRKPRSTPRSKPGPQLRDKAGRIKRQVMFAKLRTARYLKTEASGAELAIGFAGRIGRIARIHQLGESAAVAPGGPTVKYPARALLGLTAAERDRMRDQLLAHLAP